jgi:hypothetical protein
VQSCRGGAERSSKWCRGAEVQRRWRGAEIAMSSLTIRGCTLKFLLILSQRCEGAESQV